MSDNRQETVLITGASSGIGAALAARCAAGGGELVLVARAADRLRRLAADLEAAHAVRVTVIVADLASADAARGLAAELDARGLCVDILINNAGVGLYGDFADIDADASRAMLELDVVTLTDLTRRLLPGMLARGHGRIVNIASLYGFQPGAPGMAVYCAAKNYVLAFSRALRVELRGRGVSVTTVCPGPTATGFEQHAGMGGTRLFGWLPVMQPEVVAEAAYAGMRRGRGIVIPGLVNRILALAGELPPRRIALAVNRMLLRQV